MDFDIIGAFKGPEGGVTYTVAFDGNPDKIGYVNEKDINGKKGYPVETREISDISKIPKYINEQEFKEHLKDPDVTQRIFSTHPPKYEGHAPRQETHEPASNNPAQTSETPHPFAGLISLETNHVLKNLKEIAAATMKHVEPHDNPSLANNKNVAQSKPIPSKGVNI